MSYLSRAIDSILRKTPVLLVSAVYSSGLVVFFATGCGEDATGNVSKLDTGSWFGPGTDLTDTTSDTQPDTIPTPWYVLPDAKIDGTDFTPPDDGVSTADAITETPPDTATPDTTGPAACPQNPADCASFTVYPNQLKYPLIFAHGAGGFEKVGPYSYFYLIPETLRQHGFAAYVAELDPFNTTAVRGTQLAQFVDRVLDCTCAEQVSIIGHSQGGLDSRYLVSTLGYGDRVASITTIATPHHGTAVADIVLGLVPGFTDDIINFVLWFAGNLYTDPVNDPEFLRSMEQFSIEGARKFNAENPDIPSVSYYSWAGRAGLTSFGVPQCQTGEVENPPWTAPVGATLVATWTALGGGLGIPNDGMVTVDSAKWGRFRGCIAADHLAEVGQIAGMTGAFPYLNFYLDLAEFLRAEGH